MNITDFEEASALEIQQWIESMVELTPYQRERLNTNLIGFHSLVIYKRRKKAKANILWRLSIFLFIIYVIIMIVATPIKWLLTGNSRYSENYYNKFHGKWLKKMGL